MACRLCEDLIKGNKRYFISRFDSEVLDAHIWIYDFVDVQPLICECKYRGNYCHYRHLANDFCAVLNDVQAHFAESFMLTHVPTIEAHVRKRGFDHCEIMAKIYARNSGITRIDSLTAKHITSQVGGSRLHRFSNPVFVPRYKFNGENFIIIDDVASTRSTLFAASKALKSAGAGRVLALTLGYKNLSKNYCDLLRM